MLVTKFYSYFRFFGELFITHPLLIMGHFTFFRNKLGRITVTKDYKKDVNALLDFLEIVIKGHWLAYACDDLVSTVWRSIYYCLLIVLIWRRGFTLNL